MKRLEVALARARDRVHDLAAWDEAEAIARDEAGAGRSGAALPEVARACARAILEGGADAARLLGPRLLRMADACVIEPSPVIAALERALDLLPTARWALERLTLHLASGDASDGARLLARYDRAIAATADARERDELRVEAATVARDVARDSERAFGYAAAHLGSETEEVSVRGSERLDAQLERIQGLVALLAGSAPSDGPSRAEARPALERSAITIRIVAGEVRPAIDGLAELLARGVALDEIVDLVEAVATAPDAGRLAARCEAAGRVADAVRIEQLRLALAEGRAARRASARTLARLYLAQGTPIAQIEGGPVLRALLIGALAEWRRTTTDAEFGAAAERVLAIVDALARTSSAAPAARLLARAARLRFDRPRQRVLLERAAVLYAGPADDPRRAMRLFNEVVTESDDKTVAAILDRFVALLRAGQPRGREATRRAAYWQMAAHRAAGLGRRVEASAWLVEAAELWERGHDETRAVAAYEKSATLGAPAAHAALGRIHHARGRLAAARASLGWLVARPGVPGYTDHVLALADVELALGEADRACRRVEDLLRDLPGGTDGAVARARLRRLYRDAGRFGALRAALEREAALATDGPRAAVLLGEAADVCLEKLGDRWAACALFEQAVERDPWSGALRVKLAAVLATYGHWAAVVDVLAAWRELVLPKHLAAERHRRLAEALGRLGRPDDALIELREAARRAPRDPALQLALAELARDRGDLETSARAYRAILHAHRRARLGDAAPLVARSSVFLALARIAERGGVDEQAASLFESAITAASDEGTTEVLAEASLARARAHLASDELVEAFEWLDGAVHRCDSPELAQLHVELATDLGRASGADTDVREAGAETAARTPRRSGWFSSGHACSPAEVGAGHM